MYTFPRNKLEALRKKSVTEKVRSFFKRNSKLSRNDQLAKAYKNNLQEAHARILEEEKTKPFYSNY